MWTFGSGILVAIPLKDASGNSITNGTPVQFGILQETVIDEEFEHKMLYGGSQFPVDVGRGKGKVTIKAKTASIFASVYNSIFYGQTLTSGLTAIVNDTTGEVIPATPFTITVAPPNTGTIAEDLGVTNGAGVPYVKVASAPTTGQYSVAGAVYTFAAADTGKTVFINYSYTATTITTAQNLTVINKPMGYQPSFECHFQAQKNGKTAWVKYPNCVSNKLTSTYKNDDFAIPEFDAEAFADANGNIAYKSWYE